MQYYRFSLPKKQAIVAGEKHWLDRNPITEKRVIERIQREGPLRAKDFERESTKKVKGWRDWKLDEVVLEQLFIECELNVS